MKKIIMASVCALAVFATAANDAKAQSATTVAADGTVSAVAGDGAEAFRGSVPEGLVRVLDQVERNNAELVALRKLRDAQTIGTRVGNSLENPEIEFGYMWPSSSEGGKTGDLTLKQAFDFPTVYANRNVLARIRAEQYGHEYMAGRQSVLLEAQTLYLDIVYLRRTISTLEAVTANARAVSQAYDRKLAAGQSNVLEVNEARFVLLGQENDLKLRRIELDGAQQKLAGLNGGQPLEIPTAEPGAIPSLRPIDGFIADYGELSPEIAALVLEKKAAEREIKLGRSEGLPKLSLGYKHEFGPEEKANGIVVGLSIPMFGNRNKVKLAKAQDEYATARLHSAKVSVDAEIRELYAQTEIIAESISTYGSIVDTQKATELLSKALSAGQINITDYYAQLQPVYEAQLAMIQLQRDYMLAYARLNSIYL